MSEREFWNKRLASANVQFYRTRVKGSNEYYSEEVVRSLLELDVSLTIVDKNLAVINNRDLRGALFRVQEYIQDCSKTDDNEASND